MDYSLEDRGRGLAIKRISGHNERPKLEDLRSKVPDN
jgi:hypothetical protein